MNIKSKLSGVKYLLTFCALTILINPCFPSKAIAEENSYSTSKKTFKVTFNPPLEDQPQTSKGAASRCTEECNNQVTNPNLSLVPLIPTSAKGLTVASHPTVLAYLPQSFGQKVLFSWRDENNNDHYQTILTLNHQGGVISLTLPVDAPPLEVGKNYSWGLAIITDGKLKPDTPTIEGQIQRVALESTIRDRLQNANPLETAIIYGEAGIWYETIATLAKLKTAAPDDQNLAANWEYLLTSVGLDNLSSLK
ncbi:MAG: DUF928 domain-containing protein [Xenococcus sp. (in: cyanobacteria)]